MKYFVDAHAAAAADGDDDDVHVDDVDDGT